MMVGIVVVNNSDATISDGGPFLRVLSMNLVTSGTSNTKQGRCMGRGRVGRGATGRRGTAK